MICLLAARLIQRIKLSIAVFISSLFFLLLSSCNKVATYGHPDYFDSVFVIAAKIRNTAPDHVLPFIDSAFAAFPDPGIKDLYRKYQHKEAWFAEIGGQDDKAALYADSMLWVLRDHVQEKVFIEDYSNALLRKGDIFIRQKNYGAAIECNYRARSIIEKSNDSCLMSSYTFVLGSISFRQEKYLDAAHYMIEGLKEAAYCPNNYTKFQMVQGKLDDIGLAYSKDGKPDSALYYFTLATDFLKRNTDSFPGIPGSRQFIEIAVGVVEGNKGDIFLKKGDTAMAEQYFRKSIRTNSQAGYARGDAQVSQLKMIRLYLWQHRLAEAGEVLQALKGSLDSFPAIETKLRWYGLQLEYLGATGRPAEAYQYIKPYLKLKDSFAVIKANIPVNIRDEFQRQYHLLLLQKKNELKDNYLVIAIVFSCLVIGIASMFWRNAKRTRKLNAQISTQNNEMQLALSSLTESEKDNTRMMQIVAHDLRNPITSMTSIASLLLENKDLKPDDREMLELMKTSSLHSIDMISDLLNVNTTAESITKAAEDINVLLRYCVDLMQFRASEKQQTVTLEAEEAVLQINREKIWRVISNLIVNAVKFSPEGAVIGVRGFRGRNEYHIVVEDHGIGIPDDIKDKVFDMFTDAKRLGTRGERSFGLGLAICRLIITAHGGKIWFESKGGNGTSFFISLPYKD